MTSISTAFWSPSIWLPPNITWKDFESRPESAQFHHLLLPLPGALLLVLLRMILEQRVFRPLGSWLGISGSRRWKSCEQQPVLEAAWKSGKWDTSHLSKTTGLPERQVERWKRKKAALLRPSTLDKFAETGWRWLFYFLAHVLSVWALWDRPWVGNTFHCWYNYPFHQLDPAVWWHYMLEMAFYWSLLVTQFTDVKRKDFWEMFIHHIATLALLTLSWSNQMHRMGSLVLMVHDLADHWMELAKLCKYAGYEKCCDIAFVIFCLTWTYSRIGIFPTWIIYSTTSEAAQLVQMFPVYYIFNFLMTLLLVLHVFWYYLITLIAYRVVCVGALTDDSRSESEESAIENNSDNLTDGEEDESGSRKKNL